jgi:hypothetical protein
MPNYLLPPDRLADRSLSAVERLLVGDPTVARNDRSLVEQLALLGLNNEVQPPEVIAFTTRSALPLGDVIGGVYQTHGATPPLLIAVSGPASKIRYSEAYLRIKSSFPIVVSEKEKLKRLLDGRVRGIVIDQYICSGNTITGAELLLRDAGLTDCPQIGGQWYEEATAEIAPDLERPTSVLADKMRQIGHRCYQYFQKVR